MPQKNPAPEAYRKWHPLVQLSLFKKFVRDEFEKLGWTAEEIDALSMQDIADYFAYKSAMTKANS